MNSSSSEASAVRRWRGLVAVVTLAHALGTLNIMTVLAVAPIVQADLALTATAFGLLVSAYHGALAVSGLAAGSVVDRVGVGWSLGLAKLLLAAGALLLTQTQGFATAVAATTLMGIGYGFINPAAAKAVYEGVPYTRRATAMGIKQTGVPLGGILGAGFGILAAYASWRTAFSLAAAITILGGGLCLLFMGAHEGKRRWGRRPVLTELSAVVRDRNLNALNLSTAGYNLCQAGFFSFLTLFMREAVLASQTVAGAALGLAQMASAAGRILWGVVSDRWMTGRRARLYAYVGLAAAASFVGVALVGPESIGPALAVVLALGLTVGAYAALVQTIVVETVEPHHIGAATGYHLFIISAAGMVGPPLFGAIVDATGSFASGWLFLAVVGLLSTLVLVFGYRASGAPAGRSAAERGAD